MKIQIKPLSVNVAWQGKRFKTKDYKDYERTVFLMMKRFDVPEGKLMLKLKFGFSSTLSDIDNPVKPLVDILQKKYQFNDNRIYKMLIIKEIVPKGEEYFEYEFIGLDKIR